MGGATLPAGGCQRLGNQIGPQVIGGCPADYEPGGDVYDRGQIEPALLRRDIRDVAAPAGIEPGAVGLEVPGDEVGTEGIGDRGSWSGAVVGGAGLAARRPGSAVQHDDGRTRHPGT